MISFIVSAVVLVLLAIIFIVPTLRKQNYAFSDEYDDLNVTIAKERLVEIKLQLESGEINQQAYQQMHAELESTLALDLSDAGQSGNEQPVASKTNKLAALILALSIPLAAAGLYYQLGDFKAATGTRIAQTVIPAGENHSKMTMEEALAKLEQRLAQDPNNPDGWFMLGKTYMAVKQFHKAAAAYEKVLELESASQQPEDPELLLRYADAIAMTEGGSLTGKAKPIVDKVIKMMPNNPTVLWMAGTSESQQGNYAKALTFWYKLYPIISQDAEAQQQLSLLIKKAEDQLPADKVAELKKAVPTQMQQSAALPTAQAMAPAGDDGAAQIMVSVELDPSLKDRVSPGDTLFIFAKAMQGPPMPLAAVKKTVADLPITVSLSDAMAMMPQMKLSSFEQVKISAVISKSGQPGTQPGDLFAEKSPVNVKAQEKIKLIINQIK